MKELVISAVGPDRPGIVDQFTELLAGYDANIADSRMVNLRGQFAITMLVEVPAIHAEAMLRDLPDAAAAESSLLLVVRAADDSEEAETEFAEVSGMPYRVQVYAMDQVGLVHRITHALHLHRCNIEELNTSLHHGPHTGTPLFNIDMTVTVPQAVPLRTLKAHLEKLCDELNCDLDIEPARLIR